MLNQGAIKPFLPSIPIYLTNITYFRWDIEQDRRASTGAGAGAGVPIASLAGANIKANI